MPTISVKYLFWLHGAYAKSRTIRIQSERLEEVSDKIQIILLIIFWMETVQQNWLFHLVHMSIMGYVAAAYTYDAMPYIFVQMWNTVLALWISLARDIRFGRTTDANYLPTCFTVYSRKEMII